MSGPDFEDCDVQVYCPSNEGRNNRIYGWEAWDFDCTTSELVCDGKVVANPGGHEAENGTCFIRYTPCGVKAPPMESQCNRIEGVCSPDPSDRLCLLTSVRGSKECPASQPRQYATIGRITCRDGTHEYATWNGSIATCTAIRSVIFDSQTYELPYDNVNRSYCVLSQIDCGGLRVAWNFTERIPQGCGVSRVICGEAPAITFPPTPTIPICTSYSFGCRTPSTTCVYAELSTPCSTMCNQPGIVETCDCPVDYTGSSCSSPRPISCKFNISDTYIVHEHSAIPEHYNWTSDCRTLLQPFQLGEPVCHPILSNDLLSLTGRLNCSFSDSALDSILRTTVTDFNYSVWAQNFRISNNSSTRTWQLAMKALNYAALTDTEGAAPMTLSDAQMAGNETISFILNSRNLNSRFKVGGRVRLEWLFLNASTSPATMARKVMYGATIDLMDWKEAYPKASSRFSGRILTIALLSLLGAFIAGLFIFRYISKRKSHARHH